MPNSTQLEFSARRGGQSQREQLRAIFLAKPNVWLSMVELGGQIGAWAVHSRVPELRKRHGMKIDNRREVDKLTGQCHSFYRYVPAAPSDCEV